MIKSVTAVLALVGTVAVLSLPTYAAEAPASAHADLKVEDAKAKEKETLEKAERETRAADKAKEAAALKAGNKAEAEKFSKDAHERLEKEHQAKADVVADKAKHAKDEAVIHGSKQK